ncbi:ATP-binding response regulator [Cupriavidus basilensis]|uniref:ATP-binding response regulator n=1 Tax=Cupriavidus basilensis TaxID=68895 RepID=UPI0020A6A6F2|nr:ATP-binding protein [Cupriavidus basilensis]MCP3018491.1 response regulator [Cupriavidus basilensis]
MPDSNPLFRSGSPLRVLVVDDIDASRAELAQLVRAAGHLVIEAASGARALELVGEQHVDLVLLDLLMPDMNGYQATRRLRATERGAWLPVVVMSSMLGAPHFVRAIEEGADDYLVKPVDPQLLGAKLRNIGRVLELQARLAALATHNRELFDHIGDAVLTVEGNQRIRDANAAAMALLGLEVLPPGGVPLDTVIPDGLPTTEGSGQALGELLVHCPDGTTFPAEVRLSRWQDETPERVSLVIRDLTERRRLERLKDEFLSAVSHELRTPLTSVMGAIGLLAGGAAGPLPKPVQQLAEVAQRNAERLGRLIDDVLDLTKLEADRMTLYPRVHALDRLLDEAVDANQDYARRLDRILRRQGPPTGLEVYVDGDRFLQLMANLLSNGLKHTRPDQPVEVRCSHRGQQVRIAVRDGGPGIPPAFRARLFEKFSQADSSDRRTAAGTGLGLHLSRVLVERMGGAIGVISSPGQGAEFYIDLPLWQGAPPIAGQPAASPPCVLVVDRDRAAQSRMQALMAAQFQVVTASTLEELPAAALPVAPALLIVDPQGAGVPLDALAVYLRRLAGPAPVLLYSDAVDPSQAQDAGFGFISKRDTDNETFLRMVRQATHLAEGG